MRLRDLAEITGGSVVDADPAIEVSGAAFLDSRTPEPDGIFVAFEGEHADGHDFAVAALDGGASVVLGTRRTGVPTVVVDDARRALQALARTVLARLRADEQHLTVFALTGSQGKTTAKDMLEVVLAQHAPTIATAGSFNNELGLPLTVLRAGPDTRYLVLEMGARGVGHLRELCRIAPPDISVVLNVGKAHLGEFGSREQIALAKGEIVEALPAQGGAVLNLDDPMVAAMSARTSARLWTFGRHPEAVVRLTALEVDDLGRPSFELRHGDAREHVGLTLPGEHQAMNAAAVTAAALAAGRRLSDAAAALRSVERLSRWRMEVAERPDGLVVVNDAYNANPDSMLAALRTLARMGRHGDRRTIAVLGEMRELGPDSPDEHRAVGAAADELGIDTVVVVGEGAREIHTALAQRRDSPDHGDLSLCFFDTAGEAAGWLGENVAGPDVVLVKASRAAQLEQVADALLAGERQQSGQGKESGG